MKRRIDIFRSSLFLGAYPAMAAPFVQRSAWIWSAEGTHAAPAPESASPSHYQVRLFRRVFLLENGGREGRIAVSADSRYVLYCNGALIGRGPARGDVHHQFYDTYELAPYLHRGANVLAALVLDMSHVAHRPAALGAPGGVMTYAGGFLLEGGVVDLNDRMEILDTGAAGWKVTVDRSYRFQNDGTRFEGYHGYFEHRVSAEAPADWTAASFDDSAWPDATVLYRAERLENRRDPASPYGLVARMIPPMEVGRVARFAAGVLPGGGKPGAEWKRLAAGKGAVTIPARSTVRIILDAGRMTTAYPLVQTDGGPGAHIRLTYAEALRLPWSTVGARMLGRPQSLANLASHFADESSGWTFDARGHVTGWSDRWEPAGRPREVFEPWHWRSFRFVELEIVTAEEPMELTDLGYRFTAYPYRVEAEFACSDPRLERIWQTALHTMRLCSHETFVDCPHYEQMQYAGDTMITSKLAMLSTGDYALSRQALLQFDWSRIPDGLTQSRYPSRLLQVIPSWSLHWITSIRDYACCSGDLQTVNEVLPGVRVVLDWYRRHADPSGLPSRLPYWNITDWCSWWPRGVVPGADEGPTCIISAQFVQALAEAADLHGWVGQRHEQRRLATEVKTLRGVLRRRFWSRDEGLFFDKPGGPEVSQYGNAWAIVCGAATAADRKRMLARFPADPLLAPGSFFCWHAVFRALEAAGAYDRLPEFLGPWHEMVEAGLDTFVEENSYWRSLCHAWSAHPALEFLAGVLGVKALEPGFATVRVTPHRCGLREARGQVCTPRGPITVAWTWEKGRFRIRVTAPRELQVEIGLPDGSDHRMTHGRFETEVVIHEA